MNPLNHTSSSYNKPIATNGGTTRSVSAAGRVTENVSDAAGQTILTRIAPGTVSATSNTQSYDLLGRVITTVSDAGGLNQTSQYTYDVHGRTTSSKDALKFNCLAYFRISKSSIYMGFIGKFNQNLPQRTRSGIECMFTAWTQKKSLTSKASSPSKLLHYASSANISIRFAVSLQAPARSNLSRQISLW